MRKPFFLVAALLIVAPLARVAAQDASLLETVPGDAVALLSVYPREIAALGEMELFPREVISAVGLKEWKVDPLEVEQALVVVGKFTETEPPPLFLVLRFSAAPSAQKVLSAQSEGAKPDKLAEKDKYRTKLGFDVLVLDEKTLAIGSEKALAWATGGGDRGGPFLKLAKDAPKKQLSLAVHVEPVRPVLAKAFSRLSPPFNDLSKAVELTRFAQAQFDFTAAGELRLAFQTANENDAAALKKIVAQQVEFGAQAVRTQSFKAGASQDPIQRAWGVYLTRAVKKIQELTTPAQRGAEISLALKNDRTITATLGILASTAAPAIISARAGAERAQDQNRLRQILLAMHNYHDAYGGFPQRATLSEKGKPLLSWRVHLLPFLEQQALYDQFHLDEPWDSEHNKKLIEKMPDVFRAKGDAGAVTTTRYQVLVGEGVLLNDDDRVSLANITDGSSNTIAVAQVAKEKAVPWTKPDDLPVDEKKPLNGLLDGEENGFLAGFADGSAQWIPGSIDDATLRALFTRAGGEVISDFRR